VWGGWGLMRMWSRYIDGCIDVGIGEWEWKSEVMKSDCSWHVVCFA
jgi:hypothetical protein